MLGSGDLCEQDTGFGSHGFYSNNSNNEVKHRIIITSYNKSSVRTIDGQEKKK